MKVNMNKQKLCLVEIAEKGCRILQDGHVVFVVGVRRK